MPFQPLIYGSSMFTYHIIIFGDSFILFLQLLPKPGNSLPVTLSAALEGPVGWAQERLRWREWDPGSAPSLRFPTFCLSPRSSSFSLGDLFLTFSLSLSYPLQPVGMDLPLASATYFKCLARTCHSSRWTNIYWVPIVRSTVLDTEDIQEGGGKCVQREISTLQPLQEGRGDKVCINRSHKGGRDRPLEDGCEDAVLQS